MDCIETIKYNMPAFSRSQRTIANYIIDNPQRTLELSIHDLAKEMHTSAASITRFCRKLGYSSLREMRNDLSSDSQTRAAEDFREAMQIAGSPERLASEYLAHINDVCRKTLEINTMDAFDEVAAAIAKAENVYFFGIGSSALAVRNLMGKLVKLKLRCVYNSDADLNLQIADSATERDVGIAFSYSGFSRDVNQGAKNAHDNGCPLVVVTHRGASPLIELADLHLYCPAVEQLTRVTTLFSNYSQAIIADVLFLLVARKLDIDPNELLLEYRSITRQGIG